MSETTTEASTSGTLPPDGAPAPAAPPEEVGQGTGWWRLAVVVAARADGNLIPSPPAPLRSTL